MLASLLYISRAADAPPDALEAILQSARVHDMREGITGVLCHGNGMYMQVLEGDRSAVNALYRRIAQDPRHHNVEIIDYAEITQRQYNAWTMGHVDMDKLNASLLLKYAPQPRFNPYALCAQGARALLQELLQTAAIVGRG